MRSLRARRGEKGEEEEREGGGGEGEEGMEEKEGEWEGGEDLVEWYGILSNKKGDLWLEIVVSLRSFCQA